MPACLKTTQQDYTTRLQISKILSLTLLRSFFKQTILSLNRKLLQTNYTLIRDVQAIPLCFSWLEPRSPHPQPSRAALSAQSNYPFSISSTLQHFDPFLLPYLSPSLALLSPFLSPYIYTYKWRSVFVPLQRREGDDIQVTGPQSFLSPLARFCWLQGTPRDSPLTAAVAVIRQRFGLAWEEAGGAEVSQDGDAERFEDGEGENSVQGDG